MAGTLKSKIRSGLNKLCSYLYADGASKPGFVSYVNLILFWVFGGALACLDAAMIVLAALDSNRKHAPWGLLLACAGYLGCHVCLGSIVVHWGRFHIQRDTRAWEKAYPRRKFTGESYAACMVAVGLTAAALWTATSADKAQYDIWLPVAVVAQGVAFVGMARLADKLHNYFLEWEDQTSSAQRVAKKTDSATGTTATLAGTTTDRDNAILAALEKLLEEERALPNQAGQHRDNAILAALEKLVEEETELRSALDLEQGRLQKHLASQRRWNEAHESALRGPSQRRSEDLPEATGPSG